MKILGVIPARFASSRFPGKPLININGKTMIQRVYEQALKSKKLTKVIVATDDERIKKVIDGLGGECFMTDAAHESGTERVADAYAQLKEEYDYILNIQGDEPFIEPSVIDDLCDLLDYKTEIGTAVKKIDDYDTLRSPNVVKVVLTMRKQALYFSRQVIPYVREVNSDQWLENSDFYKHIGIYAYRSDVLQQIVKLPVNVLESTEKLEQLRWIGYGYQIMTIETEHESFGIDTPEDLEKVFNNNK
ncbi:3-deoxy-manno-octulosonate cytidylyltransferase [Jiulongibacter sp. NS-SX5]|uniref:3-deoxy-manno-octulosonate cytidylyltransferase n=1 Tax=Jiulongibacter sp. NS-SX5 TaxID=3463854 RepID=UPI004059D337